MKIIRGALLIYLLSNNSITITCTHTPGPTVKNLNLGLDPKAIQGSSRLDIIIRPAIIDDFPQMWEIFHPIVKQGDTYAFIPDTSYEEANNYYWKSKDFFTFVAIIESKIVGMYTIKANQPGLGSHVANASYMIHKEHQGQGIGSIIATHSLKQAKELGFKAMQFNLVVATNTSAVKLWKKMGFSIIGTLPKAFNHQNLGYVDAYVMHRFLE